MFKLIVSLALFIAAEFAGAAYPDACWRNVGYGRQRLYSELQICINKWHMPAPYQTTAL
jgi:hypothetical protein